MGTISGRLAAYGGAVQTDADGDQTRATIRAKILVRGRVQGVGFRWWTRTRARRLGLVGYARNTDDGRVEIVAQGPGSAVERLETLLREVPSSVGRPGQVDDVTVQHASPRSGMSDFTER